MKMISPALYVIRKFGNLRKTAEAVGIRHHSVVQGWQIRGRIPQWHWDAIISASKEIGDPISVEDLVKEHPDLEAQQ